MRQKRSDLPALNAPDLDVVGGETKNRRGGSAAKFGHVGGVAIEYSPADSGANRGLGDLRQGGGTHGLEDDGSGAMSFAGLDSFQNLRALIDGVVVGKDDLDVDAKFAASLIGGLRLLHLVVIVAGREGNQESWLGHEI